MSVTHPHYITDDKGTKLFVVLPIQEYRDILEEIEELVDVRLYDEAKASDELSIPIDVPFKMIDDKRKSSNK